MTFNERFTSLLWEYSKSDRQFVEDFNNAPPTNIKLTASAVTDMKNHGRTPRVDTAVKMAAFFGVSTDYLLGVTDTRTGNETIKKLADISGFDADILDRFIGNRNKYPDYEKCIHTLEFFMRDYSIFCGFISRVKQQLQDDLPENMNWYAEFNCIPAPIYVYNILNFPLKEEQYYFLNEKGQRVSDSIMGYDDKMSSAWIMRRLSDSLVNVLENPENRATFKTEVLKVKLNEEEEKALSEYLNEKSDI